MSELISISDRETSRTPRATEMLGLRGEALAAEYLVKNRYRIIVTNFKVPVGRNSKGVQVTGEIDIVALDGETLCFIEVKTRSSDAFIPVAAAVDLRKQRQISRTARVYRRVFNVFNFEYRYDIVTVLTPAGEKPTIELLKGVWDESKFRKRSWNKQPWHNRF